MTTWNVLSAASALLLLAAAPSHAAGAGGGPDERFRKLLDEEWEYNLRENPTFASTLGDRRWNDQWGDRSLAAIESDFEHAGDLLKRLDAIDPASLSEANRLNYTLFRKDAENDVAEHAYKLYLLPVNHQEGIQTSNELADSLRFATVKDYEDWIGRLRSFPVYMSQTIALMHAGMDAKVMLPKVIMQRVPDQIAAQIVKDPQESPFYAPFERFPDSISDADKARLSAAGREAIREDVVPAMKKFQIFFNEAYLPGCFDEVGISHIPNGSKAYAFLAKRFTTTDLTPEKIHEIGLAEVERIRAEMDGVIARTGFKGSFAEFLDFLRTDPRFYYDDPQDLLEAYRALAKRIDPTLVKLFETIPRMPYGVDPIPDLSAPDTTAAYYRPGAADGSRPGYYMVNLYRPDMRPKYEMEALSFHESVPGHHFQIARAMELGEIPKFRRYGGYTAFVEGWALYAESLGDELGFYEDPYSKFGQLTYEMWRAVRLVVDTGMHVMGWSRQQAIDYFKENAAKTELDIVNEIDRYISWPGQALAYKIGELKIKELRARAAEKLGDRFDVREFHDVVLGSGAVPLDVLESIVDRWIAQQQAGRSAGAAVS